MTSSKQTGHRIAEIKLEDRTINSTPEIAEAFNLHFTNVGPNLASEIPSTNIVPEAYVTPTDKVFSLQNTNVNKVYKLLKKLDAKKATALDKIPRKLLKLAADIVSPSLTHIFNESMRTGIFPSEWQLAKVSPIFRKGAKTDPNNYRPISVIPIVSKIFEKIIYNQLYAYLNNNNLLNNCQSGFWSLHSTLTALLEATNNWSLNIDNGLINGVIFIDLKKAFDAIDHNILLSKLSTYGMDENSLKWFEWYLDKRSQRCNVNGYISGTNQITCGVHQGSILGPLLFLIYINDLPNCLSKATPRMYADDTSISLAASHITMLEAEMNDEIRKLNCWLIANKLSLNIAKTEFMLIGSRQRLQTQNNQHVEIQVEGKIIKQVEETKSLGVYIDNNLSWKKHVDETSKKVSCGIGALKRLRPFISTDTAIKIYRSLIQPHFEYCSTVGDGISGHLSEKLQRLQNRAARAITKSNNETSSSLLRNAFGWENLSTIRKRQKAIMMFKTIHKFLPKYL